MEACGGAHYWARRFRAHGHEVRLMAPQFVTPYRKANKNDMRDRALSGKNTRLCREPDYAAQSANNCQKVSIFQQVAPSTEGHISGIIPGAFAIQSVVNRLHLYPLRYGKTSLED